MELLFKLLYLGVASRSVTVALARFAVWKVPESRLTFVAATAKRVLGAPALSVRFPAEGIERPLVVAITSWKALYCYNKSFFKINAFSLTLAPFGTEPVRSRSTPIAPPAHDILLARTLARILVTEGGLGSRGIAFTRFVQAAIEGKIRY